MVENQARIYVDIAKDMYKAVKGFKSALANTGRPFSHKGEPRGHLFSLLAIFTS
jgi:hypothetical protein